MILFHLMIIILTIGLKTFLNNLILYGLCFTQINCKKIFFLLDSYNQFRIHKDLVVKKVV
jgi:hypothetical protein